MTIEERNKLKASIMTEIVSKALEGEAEQLAGKIGKDSVQQFIVNVEFMADEILKRSKL